MKTNSKTTEKKDVKVILSTLWIFAVLNYIYADVFTLYFRPEAAAQAASLPQEGVLVFAILMEIAIAMILLSRVLNYRINRVANMLAGVIHTALVAWSLWGEPPVPYYLFFAAIEIATTCFIVWYAWNWRAPQAIGQINPQILPQEAK